MTLRVDLSKSEKLKFLMNTGAEISIVKGASLKPGFHYEPTKGINVREISNALLRTEETVTLKLFNLHMRLHTVHIMGELIANMMKF